MEWTRRPNPPRRIARPLVLATLSLCALGGLPAVPTAAQDMRVIIVIPALQPEGDAPARFGRQVAEALRERIESREHRAFSQDELKETLERYGVDEDAFDCVAAYQLASREQLQLAFCGHYRAAPGGGYEFFDVAFTAAVGGARFQVPTFTARTREEAADHIVAEFRRFAQQLALLRNCNDYVGTEEWEAALRNCNDALAINPGYAPALELKANVLRELGRMDEALELFERIAADNPLNEQALYNAGYIATQLGQRAEARAFFQRYLELKPGDVAVRLTIAHELATGGDNLGALELAEAGLREFAADTAVLTLAEFAGHYAKNAANAVRDSSVEPPAGVAAPDLYRRALELYTQVYEGRGADASADILRNMVLMHRELGQREEGLAFAERALQSHGEDPGLWWVYASLLGDAERGADARAALERVAAIDPNYPGLWARMATIVVNAGELDESVRVVRHAVEAGGPADQFAALMIANAGYSQFAQRERHQEAIRWYEAAREFAQTDRTRAMADFFEGYSILQLARVAQEPRTCASARATLPRFQRARTLITGSTAYQTDARGQVMPALTQFIDIQEALLSQSRCR